MTYLEKARKAMENTPKENWGEDQDIFAASLKDMREEGGINHE